MYFFNFYFLTLVCVLFARLSSFFVSTHAHEHLLVLVPAVTFHSLPVPTCCMSRSRGRWSSMAVIPTFQLAAPLGIGHARGEEAGDGDYLLLCLCVDLRHPSR